MVIELGRSATDDGTHFVLMAENSHLYSLSRLFFIKLSVKLALAAIGSHLTFENTTLLHWPAGMRLSVLY